MSNLIRPIADRFMEKVEKSDFGCWLWVASKNERGYGQFSMKVDGSSPRGGHKMRLAHRVSYEMHKGPIPVGSGYHGVCVLHRCDTPACVNPEHLFLGSNMDNVMDRVAKNRSGTARGSENKNAVLTPLQAKEIAELCALKKIPQAAIAREFGVSATTVSHIHNRRVWAALLGKRQ